METGYITKNHIWKIAGIISTLFWTLALIGALILNHASFIDEILPILLICIPFIVISLLISMMSIFWCVRIDEEKVSFCNMFGITKTYDNAELTMVMKHYKRKGALKFYIYKDKKKITTVTQFDTNFTLVSKFINREVEKIRQK